MHQRAPPAVARAAARARRGCGSAGSRGCTFLVGPDGGPCPVGSDACTWRAACPSGERCSNLLPRGLTFYGADVRTLPSTVVRLDRSVKPVAVGGVQRISWVDPSNGAAPTAPLRVFFDGPTSTVDSSDSASATARGASAGRAMLRVEDTAGLFVDSVEVRSESIARVGLSEHNGGDGWSESVTPGGSIAIAMIQDASTTLDTALRGATIQALVDESLTLTANCAELSVTRIAWDIHQLSARALGSCAVTGMAGGAASVALTVTIVDRADELSLNSTASQAPLTPTSVVAIDDLVRVCFRARARTLPLLGARWSYQASDNARVGIAAGGGCTYLSGVTEGPATLTVVASGFSRQYPFVVGPRAR